MKRSLHSRYLTTGIEGEFEPGSRNRVLRNKLGIRKKSEMDQAEFESLVRAQEAYLDRITEDTTFTATLICEMHRDWLGEIYAWAGSYRTVDVSKEGFTWPPAFRVPDNMARLEENLLLKHTPCRPGDWPRMADDIAIVHAELLLVHPFREGNGRLARWLADLMALQGNGPVMDYGFEGRGSRSRREFYLEAVKKGYEQDYVDLRRFFTEALTRGAES